MAIGGWWWMMEDGGRRLELLAAPQLKPGQLKRLERHEALRWRRAFRRHGCFERWKEDRPVLPGHFDSNVSGATLNAATQPCSQPATQLPCQAACSHFAASQSWRDPVASRSAPWRTPLGGCPPTHPRRHRCGLGTALMAARFHSARRVRSRRPVRSTAAPSRKRCTLSLHWWRRSSRWVPLYLPLMLWCRRREQSPPVFESTRRHR